VKRKKETSGLWIKKCHVDYGNVREGPPKVRSSPWPDSKGTTGYLGRQLVQVSGGGVEKNERALFVSAGAERTGWN